MRIEDAIKQVQSLPNSWVRTEQIRRIAGGLELWIGIHDGRRGRKTDGWRIKCLGVRHFQIADVDGGGIAVYSGSHPAARQFVAPLAVLGWDGGDDAEAIGALCVAHAGAVDDWISFDRYVDVRAITGQKFTCRGPDFLLRAYAKALRDIGKHTLLETRNRRNVKRVRLRVLHFGESSVVATNFIALPLTAHETNTPRPRTARNSTKLFP